MASEYIYFIRGRYSIFDHNEYFRFERLLFHATSQFGTLVQYNIVHHYSDLYFILYHFQLAIDFVTDWEECLLYIQMGYIKRKYGIAYGYCILCTTMPRINWLLLLKTFCCCCCCFPSHQEHSRLRSLFSYPIVDIWFFASPHL